FPMSASAAEKPTFVLRIQPIDTLLTNLKQLATLAGKAEEAKQIDGFVRSRIGENGIDGIDVKRPLGIYALLGTDINSARAVAVIPIASQKELLTLLKTFNLAATKGKDGIYAVTPEQIPVSFHFRFANESVYLTGPDKGALVPDSLVAPADLFPTSDA